MKKIWRTPVSSGILGMLLIPISMGILNAQNFLYHDSWGDHGFSLVKETPTGLTINFSVGEFSMEDHTIGREVMKTVMLPGAWLQNNEGAPNLPGRGQYIALPRGAVARIARLETRTISLADISVSPAPRIPLVTDPPPLFFEKAMDIYGTDAFYPTEPVILSEPRKVRGVDAVVLGITPFQYNPVTRELIVVRDILIEIAFEGGSGHFGDDRYRSRTWDPILQNIFINHASLPTIDYTDPHCSSRVHNWEYVIITPDNPGFIYWADSLRKWRNAQGIQTGVVTLDEIGGNNSWAIEAYINNAYNNWPVAPSAFLLLGDYGTSGDNCIVSPQWNGYCISDNLYADVDGDDLPDVVLARIAAQNGDHLQTMIGKMMDYELSPPTDPAFYDHPVSAGGWQSDRWFILCADICLGFWEHELGKNPVREYAGFGPGAPTYWSTNPNTSTVVNYFGPFGLGYIPQTPSHLTDWGGNATRINTDLNAGAFMIIHRDHGVESGWDSPSYHTSNLSGLDENPLSFVFSLNCLTGKFNISGECFAEGFHRHEYGALGTIAATEVSYSFVNDTYAWGLWDDMWPGFDPGYGSPANNSHWIRPAFANASAKYYLEASNWPYNPQNKPHTYYLFHHHGDAYLFVFSEQPQTLSVSHGEDIPPGSSSFPITATAGSLIGLSVDGQYLASAIATGYQQHILITPQAQGTTIKVVVTRQNYIRYEGDVQVAGPPTPAIAPFPSHHAQGVLPFTTLHWSPGPLGSVDYYKMYLGTDNPPSNEVNGIILTDTFCIPPNHLDFETLYYWQVKSYNSYGETTSEIWEFTIDVPPDENFETGDFSSFDWYFEGNADWQISDAYARHGAFSARSGNIDEGKTSSLLIENESESFFMVTLSFWVKTSTLAYANKLEFLVDGSVMGEWSGETDWAEAAISFSPGFHTFEWKYSKTQSPGNDQDAVWIDYVVFPLGSIPILVNAGEDMTVCAGSSQELDGNASHYTSLLWSTSGDGLFDDPSILDPFYTPGEYDLATGAVILTLTAFRDNKSQSDDLILSIQPLAEVYAGDSSDVCEGEGFTCAGAYASHCQALEWSSSGDGYFSDPGFLQPVYFPGINDITAGNVELTLTGTGIPPCGDMARSLELTIKPLPAIPQSPTGPEIVDVFYTPVTVYSTAGAANSLSYIWNIQPPEAGTLDGETMECIVSWNPEFHGMASICVKGVNECGEGPFSEILEVLVYNTVGLEYPENNSLKITVHPNPSTGDFKVRYFSENTLLLTTVLISSLGEAVFREETTMAARSGKTYSFTGLQQGIYFLRITSNQGTIVKKIIIVPKY